jgi:uncharacterized protein
MSEVVARLPHGAPCWVSLLVRNLPAAQDFYSSLFGWRFRPGPEQFGPYEHALLDGRQVAGMGELPEGRSLAVAWTTYFSSDSADLTAQRIRENGGTLAVGPLDQDSAGRMVIASDPSGAVFGVWEPLDDHGVGVQGEPGTLAWNELITRDSTWVGKFYTAVFSATAEEAPTPFVNRLRLSVGGRPVAGITSAGDELPRGQAPYWMTYFTVEDCAASAARVVELGGRVIRAPYDTLHGRQATVADPEGAIFSLIEPTS